MQDESNTPQDEEEVEGHNRPHTSPEDPGKHFEREEGEEGKEDEDVEGHRWPRTGPSDADKHFKHF
ncbi:MAG: hypothetical protein ACJ764_08335 [Solirubrobacteraceae bacterium]